MSEIKTHLFGSVRIERVGEVCRADVLGITVYMRVGNAKWIIGLGSFPGKTGADE